MTTDHPDPAPPTEGELLDPPPAIDPALAALLARPEPPPVGSLKSLEIMGETAKRQKIGAIVREIKDGMPPESACWLCGVDPEEIAQLAQVDRDVRIRLNQARAFAERVCLREVRKGGKGLETAKAHLEILKATHATWQRTSKVKLEAQFQDAILEAKKRLRGTLSGEQAFSILLDCFRRHS